MLDLTEVHERFMRDPIPVRMGGLAANLARVGSFSGHEANKTSVSGLIHESKWFIEWTAADLVRGEIETAAQLVELQIQLARWQMDWDSRWSDPVRRAEISASAKKWSERVLELSGLTA